MHKNDVMSTLLGLGSASMVAMKDASSTSKPKLGVRWQLNAAMLSRPADLSTLVTLSQSKPQEFFEDDNLHMLVGKLLNCQNEQVSDRDTKLDVLAILANLSGSESARGKEQVRTALQGVSEWFDGYLSGEQGDDLEQEPELHKSMLLLLARAWNYKLKTEDLLELTRGDRGLALDSVVGVLKDGRTYATELVQSRKPGEGYVAQWEHELVCRQYEKPLVLQLCRLVRGFTHPASYFAGRDLGTRRAGANDGGSGDVGRGEGRQGNEEDLALFSVDEFSAEMDSLLEIALRSRVIEKLSVALHACLFATHDRLEEYPETDHPVDSHQGQENDWGRPDPHDSGDDANGTHRPGSRGSSDSARGSDGGGGDGYREYRAPLEDSDHLAVHCVHMFTQNLYHYANRNTDFYRQHMLSDTLLVPRLVLPYLDQCVRQTRLLCHRYEVQIAAARSASTTVNITVARRTLTYLQWRILDPTWRGPSTTQQPKEGWVTDGDNTSGNSAGGRMDETEKEQTKAETALAQGIASSLRTLVIASFRAPPNKFVLGLMQRLNPTGSLLRARPFVARHDYIFTLLCQLNINMGALNSSALVGGGDAGRPGGADVRIGGDEVQNDGVDSQGLCLDTVLAQGLLDDMAGVFQEMSSGAKRRVVSRVTQSGALPVSRDAPGYAAVLGVLGVVDTCEVGTSGGDEKTKCRETEEWACERKTAKSEAEARVEQLSRAPTPATAGIVDTQDRRPSSSSPAFRTNHRPQFGGDSGASVRGERKENGTSSGRNDDNHLTAVDTESKPQQSESKSKSRSNTGGEAWFDTANGRRHDAAEAKFERQETGDGETKGSGVQTGLKLLGHLPSFGRKTDPAALADLKKQRLRVDLDLPRRALSKSFSSRIKAGQEGTSHADGSRAARLAVEPSSHVRTGFTKNGAGQSGGGPNTGDGGDVDEEKIDHGGGLSWSSQDARSGGGECVDGLPKEFLCAINGHIMKQPARSPHGHVFEYSTIVLWLESRGGVCPFTGKPLRSEDLLPDEELRTRIMRWHIQKTSATIERRGLEGDDMYDF